MKMTFLILWCKVIIFLKWYHIHRQHTKSLVGWIICRLLRFGFSFPSHTKKRRHDFDALRKPERSKIVSFPYSSKGQHIWDCKSQFHGLFFFSSFDFQEKKQNMFPFANCEFSCFWNTKYYTVIIRGYFSWVLFIHCQIK